MEPVPGVGLLRTLQPFVLLLGGAGMWWWFLGMPNFHNVLEYGLGTLLSRGAGEIVLFFGLPAFGLAQLGLALGLWRGWGAGWLPAAATVAAVVDVVVGVGFAVLAFSLRNFNMH